MRLICPNCDAEYEVDGSLLPVGGRDVQCSNCQTTWFQKPDLPDDPLDLPLPPPGGAAHKPQRPATDPAALDIIHEEVARETRARQSETAGLETQPALGLEQASPRDETLRDALGDELFQPYETPDDADAVNTGDDQNPAFEDDDAALRDAVGGVLAPAPQREELTKKELFPDIEEINSTLASAPDPTYEEEDASAETVSPRRTSGFRIGFGLMLMLAAGLMALYVYAPVLAVRFPGLEPLLSTYVLLVNSLRVSLESGAQWLLEKVNAATERFGS